MMPRSCLRSAVMPSLCLQYLLVSERPLQGWLHLHVAELGEGKVQVADGLRLLLRVVLQQQLGELKAGEGYFGAESHH